MSNLEVSIFNGSILNNEKNDFQIFVSSHCIEIIGLEHNNMALEWDVFMAFRTL